MLSANQIAGFLNQIFLQNKSMKQSPFFSCWYKFTKIKSCLKMSSLGMVKKGVANLVPGLNLNVSQEWTDWINWFSVYCYKFRQIKKWLKIFGMGMVRNGWGQSGNGTLKLSVFDEWTDGLNWFYGSWYRFTKIKRWSKNFWLIMVKNRCGQSGHRNLKLTVSQKMSR